VLFDLAANKPLYTQKLKETDKNWDAAIAVEPEPIRKPLTNILAQLRQLRAQRFATGSFNPDHADTPQGPRPWHYRLDYTIAYNGGGAAQSTPSSLLLTDRLAGKTQLAGTADFGGVVFSVTQELLDGLFPLTYGPNDPGPVAAAATPTATTPTSPPPVSPPLAPLVAPPLAPAETKNAKP
jgi:hypothetical protein